MDNKKAAIMALASVGLAGLQMKRRFPKTGVKECLNCGLYHGHNNSFCSAECCKKYKDKK